MIITIGRQFGSGGKELGEKLAKQLGYKFYDEELVEMAAEKSNIHSSVLKMADEKANKSLLYSIVTGMDSRFYNPYYELPINDKLFIEQSNIIKDLAQNDNCVIVGRCADYVLESSGYKSVDIFVYASLEHRIERISQKHQLTKEKAKEKIKKVEKGRKTYYNYYTSKNWGETGNYNLCIDTSDLSIADSVDVVLYYLKKMEGINK